MSGVIGICLSFRVSDGKSNEAALPRSAYHAQAGPVQFAKRSGNNSRQGRHSVTRWVDTRSILLPLPMILGCAFAVNIPRDTNEPFTS